MLFRPNNKDYIQSKAPKTRHCEEFRIADGEPERRGNLAAFVPGQPYRKKKRDFVLPGTLRKPQYFTVTSQHFRRLLCMRYLKWCRVSEPDTTLKA